ncbi:MAG TPA: DUF4333 domain-containing protein [Acidimicrobiales bacterium]|nr:DUF4333 domain-containing protein [Acidimicrobiales bacterium]
MGGTPPRPGRSLRLPALALTVLALCLSVISGCSLKATSTFSARSLNTRIADQLTLSYHVSSPTVHCPARVPVQTGATFTCTAVLNGQALELAGTVSDTHGHFQLRPMSAVIVMATARRQIAATLSRTFGRPVSVACPEPALFVARPGQVFNCTALVVGIRRQAVVTVTSLSGSLRLRVLPYKPPAGPLTAGRLSHPGGVLVAGPRQHASQRCRPLLF